MHPCMANLIPWPVEANSVFLPKNISEMTIINLQLAHMLCASFSTIFVAERINMLWFCINAQLVQLLNHYINVQLIQYYPPSVRVQSLISQFLYSFSFKHVRHRLC